WGRRLDRDSVQPSSGAHFHRRFIARPRTWPRQPTRRRKQVRKRSKAVIIGASALALGAGGAGIATATGAGEDSKPIGGRALEEASAAALKVTGNGKVTETEVGDEVSYYQVEVTKPDGSQIDVQLDRGFKVVSQAGDSESSGRGD